MSETAGGKRWFWQFLRGRLLLAAFLITALIFSLLLFDASVDLAQAEALAEERALGSARTLASNQAHLIEGGEQLLLALTQLAEVQNQDEEGCSALFRRLLEQYPNYTVIAAADSEGVVWCSGLPQAGAVSVSDRAWFQEVLATRRFTVSDFLIGRLSNQPVMTLAYPLETAGGDMRGAVFAGLSLAWFSAAADLTTLPPRSTLTITDSNGLILARHPQGDWLGRTAPGIPAMTEFLRQHPEGVVRGVGVDGEERLYAFMPLSPLVPGALLRVGIPVDVAFAEATRSFWRSLALFFAVALLVFAVLWFGSDRLFLRKVEALVTATRRLGEGDLSVRSGLAAERSELGELARSFDRTVEALSEQRQSAQEAEAELRDLAADLQRSNDELASFAYAVSHDLRTPLSGISGFSQALAEDYGDSLDDTAAHYLQRIQGNVQRMGRLIDDLLLLSSVSRKELNVERLDLCELATAVVEDLRSAYPEHRPDFSCADEATLEGDVGLLRIAITNLLDNAWKYSSQREDAQVTLGVKKYEGEPTYFVRDNGAGFDMAYAHALFQPFSRLHADSSFKGTGIGLATVRRIIERHGGRIWAEAKPGEGATFFFTLPPESPQLIPGPPEQELSLS